MSIGNAALSRRQSVAGLLPRVTVCSAWVLSAAPGQAPSTGNAEAQTASFAAGRWPVAGVIKVAGTADYVRIDENGVTVDDKGTGPHQWVFLHVAQTVMPRDDWWFRIRLKVKKTAGPRIHSRLFSSVSDGSRLYHLSFSENGVSLASGGLSHKMSTTDSFHTFLVVKDTARTEVGLYVDGQPVGSLPLGRFEPSVMRRVILVGVGTPETAQCEISDYACVTGAHPDGLPRTTMEAAATVEQEEISVAVHEAGEGRVYLPGQEAHVSLELPAPAAEELSLAWTLSDYRHVDMRRGTVVVPTGERGASLRLAPECKGFFHFDVSGPGLRGRTFFSFFDRPDKDPAAISSTWPMGICSYLHFYERDEQTGKITRNYDLTYEMVKERLGLWGAMGFKHVRLPSAALSVAVSEGEYRLRDPLTKKGISGGPAFGFQSLAASELGMVPVGWILNSCKFWMRHPADRPLSDTEKKNGFLRAPYGVDMDKWADFAAYLARHYRTHTRCWEVGNEMDSVTGVGGALLLLSIIHRANLRVKEVDPLIATSHFSTALGLRPDRYGLNLGEALFALGRPYFDRSFFHDYSWSSPKAIGTDFEHFKYWMRRTGGSFGESSWISETAFNSNRNWSGGVGMDNQANFHPRAVMLGMQAGSLDYETKYIQYLDVDDEPLYSKGMDWGSMGFLMMCGERKPAYGAWVFFMDFMMDSLPLGMTEIDGATAALFYSLKYGEALAAVWTVDNHEDRIRFPAKGNTRFYDLFGNTLGATDPLPVSGAPIYVRAVPTSLAAGALRKRCKAETTQLQNAVAAMPTLEAGGINGRLDQLHRQVDDLAASDDATETDLEAMAEAVETTVIELVRENRQTPLQSISPSFVAIDALRLIETLRLAAILRAAPPPRMAGTEAVVTTEKRLAALRKETVDASRPKAGAMLLALRRTLEFSKVARRRGRGSAAGHIAQYAKSIARVADVVAEIERPYFLRACVRPEVSHLSVLAGAQVDLKLIVESLGRERHSLKVVIPENGFCEPARVDAEDYSPDQKRHIVVRLAMADSPDVRKGRIPIVLTADGRRCAPMFVLVTILDPIAVEIVPLDAYPAVGGKLQIRLANRGTVDQAIQGVVPSLDGLQLKSTTQLPTALAGESSATVEYEITGFEPNALDMYGGTVSVARLGGESIVQVRVPVKATRPLVEAKRIDRSQWTAKASVQLSHPNCAFDGNRDSRWGTGTKQDGNESFVVDMAIPHNLARVEMLTSHSTEPEWNDYPEGLLVETSLDHEEWSKAIEVEHVRDIENEGLVTLTFAPRMARFVRLIQTESMPKNGLWWSIYELNAWSVPRSEE